MIHPLSDCQCKNVPESTRIWQFCVIMPNAQIGEDCNICSHCLIENEAVIGNRCTIKCGVQVWDGIELEDNVFVGSNVTFTNNKFEMPSTNVNIKGSFSEVKYKVEFLNMKSGKYFNDGLMWIDIDE